MRSGQAEPMWCIFCIKLGVVTVTVKSAVTRVWEKWQRTRLRAIVFVVFCFVVSVVVITFVVTVSVAVVAVLFVVLLLFPEGRWVGKWVWEKTRISRGMVVSSEVHRWVGLVNSIHGGGGENISTVHIQNRSIMSSTKRLGIRFGHVMKGEGDGKGRTERSWGERR